MRTLRSEWTKFRTVRGWVIAVLAAAPVAVLFLLAGTVSTGHREAPPPLPVGPGGEAVNDSFSFVHRTLTGDGSLTVPVTALTGLLADPAAGPGTPGTPGVTPWAKAGIIIKSSLTQGTSYAAVTATGAHGVRMQADYVHDRAADQTGRPTPAAPQWLRLVRTGTTVTGYDSRDGVRWTRIGAATVQGATVQAGLFVTSPSAVQLDGPGGTSPAVATGTFGRPAVTGAWHGGWTYTKVGPDAGTSGSYLQGTAGGSREIHAAGDRTPDAGTTTGTAPRAAGDRTPAQSGATADRNPAAAPADSAPAGFVITGAGDIAPVVGGPALGEAVTVDAFLTGTFVALIVVGVAAVQFATGEYRRGLLGVTLAATPRRAKVPAAKAAVVAGVAAAVGVVAAAVSVPVGRARSHAAHYTVLTVPSQVELRAVLGTALLMAAAAVLAVALGVLLRRSAPAITVLVATTVLPYLLTVSGLLPNGPARWLLRVTPAAGFAIQQTLPRHEQVLSVYAPATGYFPLPPWGGLAVLAGWALAALAAATLVLRRRDV